MAQIIDFKLSKEDYLALARQAEDDGDVQKSIVYLKKALDIDEKFSEASICLANQYASLGIYDLSNATLYRALYLDGGEPNRERVFTQLAMNFLDMNEPLIAEYYLCDYAEGLDIDLEAVEQMDDEDNKEKFQLVYPKDERYYQSIVRKAFEMIKSEKLDDALLLLDEVDKRANCKDEANHLVLVCLMMKNDVDAVIANAKRMLQESTSQALAVKCTLATALFMEEKVCEAGEIVDEILQNEFASMEEILLVLPLLVNLEMHAEVVKYTKKVLASYRVVPNIMIWLSQALYNLGQVKEAIKVMKKVEAVFEEYSPADYYIKLYEQRPERVDYSMALPYSEKIERYNRLEKYMTLSAGEFALEFENSAELKSLVKWAMADGNEKLNLLIVAKLKSVKTRAVDEFLRRQLVSEKLSFDLMASMLWGVIGNNVFANEVDVVAQDRYKEVYFNLPCAYFSLPHPFKMAVNYCVSDIVFTDETPTLYLSYLCDIVDGIATIDESGKLEYKNAKYEKVARFRSVPTLIGVLLSKVYEGDDNPRLNAVLRYGLNVRTFDKYYKILFGE